jgi:hypothetical protein
MLSVVLARFLATFFVAVFWAFGLSRSGLIWLVRIRYPATKRFFVSSSGASRTCCLKSSGAADRKNLSMSLSVMVAAIRENLGSSP